jgi:hypothetical protein
MLKYFILHSYQFLSGFMSFLRKQESSDFRLLWTLAGVYPVLDTGQ